MKRHRTRRAPGLLLTILSLLAIGLVGHAFIRLISSQPVHKPAPQPAKPARPPDLPPAQIQADLLEPVRVLVPPTKRSSAKLQNPSKASTDPLEDLFRAMRVVESVDSASAVGDGGRSRGPYQISRLYWKDATRFGEVRWSYIDGVWHERECRQVMLWYWQRYAPAALAEARRTGSRRAMEILARTHNGGPQGADKPATLRYWRRIQRRLPASEPRTVSSAPQPR